MASFTKRQTKSGTVWDVRFRVFENGEYVTKHLSGFATKKDADRAAREYVPDGGYRKPARSFASAFDEYVEARRGELSQATLYSICKVFKLHILPFFKNMEISVTKADILKWQSEMWNKTNRHTGRLYAQGTCEQARAFLSTFLNWASEIYDFPNPIAGVKHPTRREIKKEMQVWNVKQFNEFCASCPEDMVLFYKFLFYSGARVGEINALTVQDVRLVGESYVLHICKSASKKAGIGGGSVISPPKTANSNRDIPLPTGLTDEITAFLKGRKGYVFGGKNPLNEHVYQRCFNETIEKAGLPKIRIHDLRHSHATMLINSGVPITTVSKRLGHASVKMTLDTYSHCYKENEDRAVQMLDEIMKQKHEPYRRPLNGDAKAS